MGPFLEVGLLLHTARTYIHTHTRACTYIHTQHTCTYTHIHTHTHIGMHMHNTYTHMHTHTYGHTHTHTHTHAHTHRHTHTHTRTHTHTHQGSTQGTRIIRINPEQPVKVFWGLPELLLKIFRVLKSFPGRGLSRDVLLFRH
jgi:hypothetical protein